MSEKSIFSYHKTPACAYCKHNKVQGDAVECAQGSEKMPCEQFEYDVFKRVPRQTPSMPSFKEDDFSI